MYYLHARGRNAQPPPAEPPCTCNADGLHEWSYGLLKHKAALKSVKGLVDLSPPHSIDPAAQKVQAHTKRFCEDQRRAEIGRENRKLVERLHSISRGLEGSADPRSPPPSVGVRLATSVSSVSDHSRSLNEPLRRKVQHTIDEDNASMVRRILHTKGTFDRAGDERDFRRHRRAGQLLQRLPGGGPPPPRSRSQPRSLPPLRPLRVMSHPTLPLKGLDMLLLPGDLRRSDSGPSTLGAPPQRPALSDWPPSTPGTSPPPTRPASRASAGAGRQPRPSSSAGLHEGSPTWPKRDAETERRSWRMGAPEEELQLEQEQDDEGADGLGDLRPPALAQTGLSIGSSEVPYEDEWDEDSMSQSGSRSRPSTSR